MKLLVASWSFIMRSCLTAAYPQINGNDMKPENGNIDGNNSNNNIDVINQNELHSVGYATILVNNEQKHITERMTPLNPSLDVRSAMIIDAPHGSGCFFSRSVADEQSRLDNTFVSQTFYNTGREDLTIPFPAASFVTCFMIPDPSEAGADESIVLWLEASSSSSAESDISRQEEPQYELKFLNLLQESRPYTFGIHPYDEPTTLAGAAVVHAPRPEAGCSAMNHMSVKAQIPHGESDPIAQEGPLEEGLPPPSEPVLKEKFLPKKPRESNDGFIPAGHVNYFALGNPVLDSIQTDSIHCFGNQRIESGQT